MSPTYLLSTITTTLLLLSALTTTLAKDTNLVYDTNSNPLEPNKNYYLVPTNVNGGGIKPVPVGPKSCPSTFYISQEENNLNLGYPISLIHSSRLSSTISVLTKVQIAFPRFPPSYVLCRKGFPWVWGIVDKIINFKSINIVKVNGAEGVAPWFEIENHEDGNYKILYCVGLTTCGGLTFSKDVYDKPVLVVDFENPTPSFVFKPINDELFSSKNNLKMVME